MAVEEVVAQDQGDRARSDELPSDYERLRQPLRTRLHRITEADTPTSSVTEKLFEAWQVARCGDDQDLAYPG
jgi:hypothetical protein